MSLADILKTVVLPLLTLATVVGMSYCTYLLLGSEQPLAAIPCILLAGVSGYFSFLDARKIYTKLTQ